MKQVLLTLFASFLTTMGYAQNLTVSETGRYTDGREGACEISTFDEGTDRLFITNAASDSVVIVDISYPSNPTFLGGIDVLLYGGGINSVISLNNGFVAVAIEAEVKQDPGKVVFFDTDGNYETDVTVGALPDMVTVTSDGNKVIVANEGEPDNDYVVDPEGSVSIIDISGGVENLSQADVTTLGFENAPTLIEGSLQKPGVPWSQDLEPEYIAVDASNSMAAVICQEANVFVFIDLVNDAILSYKGLGFKDYSLAENAFDASNRDDGINIQNWDVKGVYQPDAIASYTVGDETFFISANEGDGRDYDGYSSETRIKDLTLDSVAFPNYTMLQEDENLGRLKSFTPDVIGDPDNDGEVEELYSYGARSFSIWDDVGNIVWDSGNDIENYIKDNHPDFFNCDDGIADEKDERSDDKGPEPEAATIGKIADHYYAFIGLERQGGIMIYDITDPNAPVFETYINSIDSDTTMIDIAPEGLVFVPAANSPNGSNLLIVSNEASGTTTIYGIESDLVSAEEISFYESKVAVFPNPTSGKTQIQLDNFDFDKTRYTLTNAIGNRVKSGLLTTSNQELDLNNLANGIYYLTVQSEGNFITTQKIIKY